MHCLASAVRGLLHQENYTAVCMPPKYHENAQRRPVRVGVVDSAWVKKLMNE